MKNIKKLLFISVFLGILIVPNISSATTVADLQAQIQSLLAQLSQLQAQLAQMQGQPAVWCYDFNRDLKYGNGGTDVYNLQIVLEKEGFSITQDEKNQKQFGESTADTVVGFQQKYKDEVLAPWNLQFGTGFVGKTTIAKLNKLYGCRVKPTPPPFCAQSAVICSSGSKIVCPAGLDEKGCPFPCKCVPISDNQPPVISGISGPTTLSVGQTGTWIVKASDPEQGVLTYQVFWGDEAVGASAQLSQPLTYYSHSQTTTFTHSYSKAGVYNPTFTVTDNQGLSVKTSISVNVGAIIVTPSITVLSPNGGETWQIGSVQTIKWNSTGVSKVSIWLCKSGTCGRFGMIPSTGITNTGSYTFTVSTSTTPFGVYVPGSDLKIRVASEDSYPTSTIYDDSDAAFSIAAATNVACTETDSGFNIYQKGTTTGYEIGTKNIISKTDYSIDSSHIVEFFCDGPNSAYYYEYVNNGVKECLNGSTDGACKPDQLPISIISPNGGEKWQVGTNNNIAWANNNIAWANPYAERVDLQLYKGGIATKIIGSQLSGNNYTWNIPSSIIPGDDYKIWIFSGGKTMDSSDAPFSIVATTTPSITVLSPNGGENWAVGSTQTIKWSGENTNSTIQILLFPWSAKNSTSVYSPTATIVSSTANTGLYSWTLPSSIPAGQYFVRAFCTSNCVSNSALDDSDAPFSIVAAGLGQSSQLNQMASALESARQALNQMLEFLKSR